MKRLLLAALLCSSTGSVMKATTQPILVNTPNAPQPIGPYSQATIAGNLVFVSGTIPVDAQGNVITDPTQATKQIMTYLDAVLQAAGSDFQHVAQTTIFLTDMSLFAEVNTAYATFFTAPAYPARATVAVKGLPKGVPVEIAMIAVTK
jgi:2-iminobutanoate/2-iminopropanoate deaminase